MKGVHVDFFLTILWIKQYYINIYPQEAVYSKQIGINFDQIKSNLWC